MNKRELFKTGALAIIFLSLGFYIGGYVQNSLILDSIKEIERSLDAQRWIDADFQLSLAKSLREGKVSETIDILEL